MLKRPASSTVRPTDEPESTDDAAPDINIPGARELREIVASAGRRVEKGKGIGRDVVAGLTATLANVPECMAMGLLVGVSPIYGLYASIVGPLTGGLFTSTQLMLINNTGAASLTAGQALVGVPSGERDGHLFLMVALAGLLAIGLGLLGLGRLTRFVSYSVMTGFLAGIAAVLVLSQLPTAVGYEVEGPNRLIQTFNLVKNLDEVKIVTLGLAVSTVGVIALLQHTRLRAFGSLLGIGLPTALVPLLGLDDVQVVQDLGEIPRGVPLPILPEFGRSLEVLSGAMSVAIIVLVQGAVVSQSVPNPDGSRSRVSRDFIAQGIANVAAGFFRGLPVGGSLSGTALSVSAGARGRWATIFTGLWMAVIVIALPGLVAQVAMPALAGLLILAGIQIIKPKDLGSVWRAGWHSRLAGVATFAATLVLPIQAAVGLGVGISTLLYLNEASTDVTLVERVQLSDGRVEERPPPKRLPTDQVTVFDIYGQLFYAGGRTLERLLPLPDEGVRHPVVVLRLHGRTSLGATLEEVLSQYAKKLAEVDGRLYLSGLSEKVHDEVMHMSKVHLDGHVRAFKVNTVVGQSTDEALADAQAWLASLKDG